MENENVTLSKTQYESIITNTLSIGGFVPYNKVLARNLGVLPAIMAGELVSEYLYWRDNNGITEDGYFYSTVENIELNTGLSRYQQKPALDILSELGIVEVTKKGLPAKRYIKIDISKLGSYLCELVPPTSTWKNPQQESGKTTLNNNNITIINNNNKESITLTSNTKESRKDSIDFDNIIDSLVTDDRLKSTIKEFIETRKAIKHPFKTENGFARTIKEALKLADNDTETAIAIFEQSIRNEYQGVFPLKNKKSGGYRQDYSQNKPQAKEESWDDIIESINNGTYVPPVI